MLPVLFLSVLSRRCLFPQLLHASNLETMGKPKNKLDRAEALRRLDVRYDEDIQCIFCASCPPPTFPLGSSPKMYCQHRADYHQETFSANDRQYRNHLLIGLKLRRFDSLPRLSDGSEPLEALPIFYAFKCSVCDFATLHARDAREHLHETSAKCWQSYVVPTSNFQANSWMVAGDIDKLNRDAAAMEALAQSKNGTEEHTHRELTAFDGAQGALGALE